MNEKDTNQSLVLFYEKVDQTAKAIQTVLSSSMKCGKGCTQCCLDDLAVYPIEAQLIKNNYKDLLEKDKPHPAGACAFLDTEGLCRIYPVRPYICRTQGLPLRWFAPGPNGDIAEFRDICPVNDDELDLTTLPDEHCFLLGPFEQKLNEIQDSKSDILGDRIFLRTLFDHSSQKET